MKKYAVKKTRNIPACNGPTVDYYYSSGMCWLAVLKGKPVPPRCTFELRGEARDVQREVGGRVVPIQDTPL